MIGELQHGLYNDEYEGLTYEEINIAYGFDKDGELVDEDVVDGPEWENDSDEIKAGIHQEKYLEPRAS